jgi:AsmA protein
MRRIVIAALAVLVVLAGLAALVPVALSSQIAKQRIADQIAEWTGRKVTFRGEPRIGFLPDLQIKIENVTIDDPGSIKPLISVPELEGRIRIAPLLAGRIEIIEFRLIRPTINLRRDIAGKANWSIRPLGDDAGLGHKRNGPTLVLDLRKVRIRDATIVYDNAESERHEEFSATSLLAEWPSGGEAVRGGGSFMWRGERVEFNGTIGNPLAMIGREASPARFALASTLVRAVFNGDVTRVDSFHFDGTATLSTPSVRRLSAWLGAPTPESAVLGAGRIEGKLDWTGSVLSFSDAQLELDGNVANGSAALDLRGAVPAIAGNLAFDALDLSPYVEAYRATLASDGPWPDAPIDLPALDLANVDVRISAEQFLIGRWRGGRLAASGTVRNGAASIEIGNAGLYGGSLTATANGVMAGDTFAGSVKAKVEAMPAGPPLQALTGITSVDGRGTLSLDLEGHGRTWGSVLRSLTGAATFALAEGTLSGIDLSALAPDTPEKGTGTRFNAAGTLEIADGAVATRSFEATGPGFTVAMSARASLESGALSGNGTLTLADPAPGPPLTFELAGTWLAPALYADLAGTIRRSEAGDLKAFADRTR